VLAEDKVVKYAQMLDEASPVTVLMLYDGSFLIDGYHRIEAAKRHGRTVIRAELRQASCRDELHFSVCLPPHPSTQISQQVLIPKQMVNIQASVPNAECSATRFHLL
jgi:hypothetical protein